MLRLFSSKRCRLFQWSRGYLVPVGVDHLNVFKISQTVNRCKPTRRFGQFNQLLCVMIVEKACKSVETKGWHRLSNKLIPMNSRIIQPNSIARYSWNQAIKSIHYIDISLIGLHEWIDVASCYQWDRIR